MTGYSFVGLGLAGFGAYLAKYGMSTTDDVGIELWGKAIIAIAAGLGLFGYENKDKVISFLNSLKDKLLPKGVSLNLSGEEDIATIRNKDREALDRLTYRCVVAKQTEGVELCKKLDEMLFNIDVAALQAKEEEKVKTNEVK